MSDSILLAPLITFVGSIGVSGLIGYCMGKFFKTAGKWIAIIVGFVCSIVFFLGYKGFLTVNYNAISNEIYDQSQIVLNESQKFLMFVSDRLDGNNGSLSIVGTSMFGFVAGFAFGIRH